MRAWFFGSGAIAVPTLQALTRAHTILGVVTQPDRSQGRGQRVAPTPIKAVAQHSQLLTLEPPSLRDPQIAERLRPSQLDVIVVMAYGGILPPELLKIPTHGAVNVHPSLLPKYRGAAPIPWAIMNDERETGISIFRMDAQVDHGPLLLQERIPLDVHETAVTLTDRISRLAPAVLLKVLAQVEQGRVELIPQDDRAATYARRLTKADGWVDWGLPAQAIARRARALAPWPGSMTSWRGRAIKLLRVVVYQDDVACSPGTPTGTILRADPSGILVQSRVGTLLVHELQVAGGRALDAGAFLHGHSMRPGDRLGGENS